MKVFSSAYRNSLVYLVCACALGFADPGMQVGAHAQLCPPSYVTFIFRDGKQLHTFYCESEWGGIAGDRIAGGGNILNEKRVRTSQIQPAFSKASVHFICLGADCPPDIKPFGAKQDIVVWKDGTRTTGLLEIKCDGPCRVYQDGKPARAAVTAQGHNLESYVSYIELVEDANR